MQAVPSFYRGMPLWREKQRALPVAQKIEMLGRLIQETRHLEIIRGVTTGRPRSAAPRPNSLIPPEATLPFPLPPLSSAAIRRKSRRTEPDPPYPPTSDF